MPIDRDVHVPLAGEVAFLASSEHRIRFLIDGAPPHGQRIVQLTLVVTSTAGAVIHRAIWCAEDHEPHDDGGVTIDDEVPPDEHTWAGTDLDDEPIPHITVPYVVTVSTLLENAAPVEEIPEDLQSEGSLVSRCSPARQGEQLDEPEAPPPPCAITSLVLHASGQASTSRTPAALRMQEAASPALLPFVRGVDDQVRITWTLENPQQATGGTLELLAADDPHPVWTVQLDANRVRAGSLTANDGVAPDFVDDHVTLPRTPLRLRLRLQGAPVDASRQEAWTWLAVVVVSFRLRWGLGRALSPNRGDVAATVRAETHRQELLLLRQVKGGGAPAQPWIATNALLADDDQAGLVAVASGANHRLPLASNVHYREIAEWANDTSFTAHRSVWGDGPRLPLVVELELRRATGATVAATAAAVEGARVLWDWQDPQPAKHLGRPCATFLQWAFERHNNGGTRSDDDSPPSTNCHVSDGGKRGTGAAPVFPPAAGSVANPVPDGTHPFRVAAHGRRPWAAVSDFHAGVDARHTGRTGVLFQPSRMAGDTYRVRAYLYSIDDPLVDDQLDGDELWAAAQDAGWPQAESGRLEVWRRLDVLRYYQKNGAAAIQWANVDAKFAPSCMELRAPGGPTPVNPLWADGNLDAVLATELNFMAGSNQSLLNVLVPGAQRAGNGYLFPTKAWSRLAGNAVAAALAAGDADHDRNVRFTGIAGIVDGGAPVSHAGSWQRVLDNLHVGDLAPLQVAAPGHFVQNPDNASVHVADTVANFGHLMSHLNGHGRKQMASRVLSLMAQYVDANHRVGAGHNDPLCGTQPGIYAFHFESVAPGLYDVSGSAIAPRGIDAANPATRKRGVCFVSFTDWAQKVEIDLQVNVTPPAPAVANINQTAYLSQGFINGAESGLDYEAFVVLRAHTAALAVLEQIPAEHVPVPPPGQLAATDMVASPAHGVRLRVRSETNALANQVGQDLDGAFNPAVQAHYFGNDHSSRSVYLSLVSPFDRQRSAKVRFDRYRNALTNANKREVRDFVLGLLRRVQHPIATIHVFGRNSNRGNARRANVVQYLNLLLAEIRNHVHVVIQSGGGILGNVYGLEALTAHELGHTVFLGHQHEHLPWRHLPMAHVNCLMNYDPDLVSDEFCGVCNLALRGWDTGPVNVVGGSAHRFHAFVGPPY